MRKNEHVTDDIHAYVLGLLELQEERRIRAHLKTCEDCSREERRWTSIVARVGLAAKPQTPPEDLRGKVLGIADPGRHAGVHRPAPRFGRALFSARVPAVALILVLLGAVALSAYFFAGRSSDQNTRGQAAVVLRMQPTPNAATATASLFFVAGMDEGLLKITYLPVLPDDRQYQLWLVRDKERWSGAVFSVASNGSASMVVSSPYPLSECRAFGITIEPKGGSPGPTGAKVLGLTL